MDGGRVEVRDDAELPLHGTTPARDEARHRFILDAPHSEIRSEHQAAESE